jgi:hypothetical protein
MKSTLNIKELATQLDNAINDVSCNIMNIFRRIGCGYYMDCTPILDKGIRVDFLFRNETDYSLVIPWEYTQDDNKIIDYYNRFQEYIHDEVSLMNIPYMAEKFAENEFKQLRG